MDSAEMVQDRTDGKNFFKRTLNLKELAQNTLEYE